MKLLEPGIGYKKLALALAGVMLLLALACGTSAAPAEPLARNEASPPVSVGTESVAPESELANAESIPVSYTIGNKVGERIPDFAITLLDGSTVTSAELLAQSQPTFLFFFATW
ncbi:MAG: hypothetical protein O2909_09245 [Chloroflexi bacterium]|nr:hypothetical protein [Chloroflexota bacterium]MDA1219611.1 hypothetical protein [Chloroflexota bacterium]